MPEFPRLVSPIPEDAPKAPREWRGRKLEGAWAWRDSDERILKVTLRFPDPERRKVVLPFTCWEVTPGRFEWRQKDLPTPRPLYGLDRLAARPQAPVLVVDGEKAADAAQKRFPEWVVVTSGSATSASNADWTPLKSRCVVVWPDADEAGRRYAEAVARALQGIASSFAVVDVPTGFPAGWDLGDDLPAGWDEAGLQGLLQAAHEEVPVPPAIGEPEPEQHPPTPFLPVDLTRVWTEAPPPIRWIQEGLLPLGMPGCLVAPGGIGKSGLALTIGAALASRVPFLGLRCSDDAPRGTLYLSMEDDGDEIKRRLADLKADWQAKGVWSLEAEIAIQRHLRPLVPNWRSQGAMALARHWRWVIDEAHRMPGGCGLIVLDTFSALSPGKNEGTVDGTSEILDAMIAITHETGSTVMALHHTPKGHGATTEKALSQRMHAEAARGSSAIPNRSRYVITALPLTPGEASRVGLDELRALREEYVCFGLTKFNQGPKGLWTLLERQGRFMDQVPEGPSMVERLVRTKATAEQTNLERVLVEVLQAGSLARLDRKQVAAKLWPTASNAVNQLNKAIGSAKRHRLLDDLGLTPEGRRTAEGLLVVHVPVPVPYREPEPEQGLPPAGHWVEPRPEQDRNKTGTNPEPTWNSKRESPVLKGEGFQKAQGLAEDSREDPPEYAQNPGSFMDEVRESLAEGLAEDPDREGEDPPGVLSCDPRGTRQDPPPATRMEGNLGWDL